jgi:hypothetical protein
VEDHVPAPSPPNLITSPRTGRRYNGPSWARARGARCGGHVTRRAVTDGPRPPTRGMDMGPEFPMSWTPARRDRPGPVRPGARSEEAWAASRAPPPDRGTARLRSGAEMGRPTRPDREGQEVRRDLPSQGSESVQKAKHTGWGRGVTAVLAKHAANRAERICEPEAIEAAITILATMR